MPKFKILVVEDEGIVARDIECMLERLGYRVSGVASRGREAIEKVLETHPDLILMDIKLKEDMDGIETAKKIRELLDIPVIFMSASSDETSLKRARKRKPFCFVPKPIEISKLQVNIEKAYSLHNRQNKSIHHR